ncbi:MAG: hypothetical protein BM561_03335 [Vibrio sp. MedPE-SWchi]|nr:hypothetical protein [uncultured Vibrio sp.]OIQ25879.1 MAG: hypothetical protein BM561_03335 [Vibrio sp. MedPE-SWchi]
MRMFILAFSLLLPFTINASEFDEALKEFISSDVKVIIADSDVISAINAQNEKHSNLTGDEIIALDKEWRSQVGQSESPLISSLLESQLSQNLLSIQEQSEGVITEIFVMDNKGLNVAQSATTSDYWQGDEAKWQKTFKAGSDAYHISEIEEDESTQMFQAQVSYAISDPASGEVIGAITVGVNVEEL